VAIQGPALKAESRPKPWPCWSWPRLAEHLASFASTVAGRQRCGALAAGRPDCAASKRRLLETTELLGLRWPHPEGGLSLQGACESWRATLLAIAGPKRHRLGGGVRLLAVATTLAAGPTRCGASQDPQLRPALHGSRPGVAQASQSWSSAFFCLEEAPGGGWPALALAGFSKYLAAGACSRERCRSAAGAWRRCCKDTVISERNGPAGAGGESGGGVPGSAVVYISFWQHGVHRNPGELIAWAIACASGKRQERQAEANGCWPELRA